MVRMTSGVLSQVKDTSLECSCELFFSLVRTLLGCYCPYRSYFAKDVKELQFKFINLFPFSFPAEAISPKHFVHAKQTSRIFLLLPHVHHAPDAVAVVHVVEGLVDARQVLAMRDELVDLQLAVLVVLDELAHLRAALDAAEGTALPHAAGDELECC